MADLLAIDPPVCGYLRKPISITPPTMKAGAVWMLNSLRSASLVAPRYGTSPGAVKVKVSQRFVDPSIYPALPCRGEAFPGERPTGPLKRGTSWGGRGCTKAAIGSA